MPSIVNKLIAEQYRKRFRSGRHFFVANVKGISGPEDNKLRTDARKNGIEIEMLKNRVVRRALKEEGLDELAGLIQEQVVIFVGEDPIKTAKAAVDAQKTLKKKLSVRGGWLDGKALTAKDVETLANIPAREVLLSMLVGAVRSPLLRLVQVLNSIPRKLVIVLNKAAENVAVSAKATETVQPAQGAASAPEQPASSTAAPAKAPACAEGAAGGLEQPAPPAANPAENNPDAAKPL